MFKNYNEQNGLPSSEAYYVFEDHEGFIWIATDNGVVRFDGGEFKLFNKHNGLADAVVFSIVEDPRHRLWFRTFSGAISVFSDGQMKEYPFNDIIKSMKTKESTSMTVDSTGQVLITGLNKDIYKIGITGKLDTLKVDRNAVNLIEVTKDNFLVNGFRSGKLRYVVMNGKKYDLSYPFRKETGFVFCHRWNNQMYVSINNFLYELGATGAKLMLSTKEPIISLALDRENHLWAGFLAGGAVRFSDSSFLHGWEVEGLKGRSVTSILQDKAGGFWFSTLEKGVFYCPSLKIHSHSLPEDSKSNFLVTSSDKVIVGFYNGSIMGIDKRTKRLDWSLNLGKPIVAGALLEKGNLLISNSHHSVLLNQNGKIINEYYPYIPLNAGSKFIAKKFFKTRDRVWGINAGGALEFDLNGNLLSFKNLNIWSRNILVMDNKEVYLAGITGLYKTDTTFAKVTEMEEFANDKISDLAILPDGQRIFVGTVGNGFKIIDGEKIASYSKANGLVFENIYSAVADRALWLATEKGLVKLDLDLLLKKNRLEFALLDKNSGLMSNKVNFIARDGGETWCVYNNGFSVFKDDEINYANRSPIPRLNAVKVNSLPVPPSQLLDLSHSENNIGFDFGFLSYNNRNIFLRHRAGPSDRWNYTEDFVVDYFSLAPGKYQFEVEYSTDRVNWKGITFPNRVIIRPVWWETVYFRLSMMLVVALFFFIYFRAKYKGRLLKLELAEKLKAEKERIAQDLHDNIGSKLVSLSLGLNNVVKEYEIEPGTADMIYSNVNTTVLELRDTIWAIQKEGITIAEFCDKIKNLVWRLRQNNGAVQYDLQIKTEKEDHVLKPTQAINLYRIVQESIANSQKHSGASSVSIGICHELAGGCLSVKVEDNGKGFAHGNSVSEESYGLKNMRARAAEVQAVFQILSNIGEGTRVLAILPL